MNNALVKIAVMEVNKHKFVHVDDVAADDLVFVLFTETTVSLLQKPFWMISCLPTLFSCLPVIYVKPCWDNILTNRNTV